MSAVLTFTGLLFLYTITFILARVSYVNLSRHRALKAKPPKLTLEGIYREQPLLNEADKLFFQRNWELTEPPKPPLVVKPEKSKPKQTGQRLSLSCLVEDTEMQIWHQFQESVSRETSVTTTYSTSLYGDMKRELHRLKDEARRYSEEREKAEEREQLIRAQQQIMQLVEVPPSQMGVDSDFDRLRKLNKELDVLVGLSDLSYGSKSRELSLKIESVSNQIRLIMDRDKERFQQNWEREIKTFRLPEMRW